jgi:hypothetical protein
LEPRGFVSSWWPEEELVRWRDGERGLGGRAGVRTVSGAAVCGGFWAFSVGGFGSGRRGWWWGEWVGYARARKHEPREPPGLGSRDSARARVPVTSPRRVGRGPLGCWVWRAAAACSPGGRSLRAGWPAGCRCGCGSTVVLRFSPPAAVGRSGCGCLGSREATDGGAVRGEGGRARVVALRCVALRACQTTFICVVVIVSCDSVAFLVLLPRSRRLGGGLRCVCTEYTWGMIRSQLLAQDFRATKRAGNRKIKMDCTNNELSVFFVRCFVP